MTPVQQAETERGRGDCLAACVASVLDLPGAAVPNFRLADDQWAAMGEWLAGRGLTALIASLDDAPSFPDGTWAIGVGQSPRCETLNHAAVGVVEQGRWTIRHDPHPAGGGLASDPVLLVVITSPAPLDLG